MSSILTVTQLNRYISFRMKDDAALKGRLIRGEISNFICHDRSGHCYFTLKDGESSVKAVMFSNFASRLRFMPSNGMAVIVQGSIQVYERDGVYQIYVNDMQPDGMGALYLAYSQLKEKLSAEGLFDEAHKKPLPAYPKKIGVITATGGAALQDILNVLNRRYPCATVIIYPALVQGADAPASICRALTMAGVGDCDVLIVGRGGGSFEDLSCFNDESVARAVYNIHIPVISAVGHETDFTICDFVADLRAPTPSAAAELAVPDITSVIDKLEQLMVRLNMAMDRCIGVKSDALKQLTGALVTLSPEVRAQKSAERLSQLSIRLNNAIESIMTAKNTQLCASAKQLEALNPLAVLARGYAVAYNGEGIVKDASTLKNGSNLTVRFERGSVVTKITEINPDRENEDVI